MIVLPFLTLPTMTLLMLLQMMLMLEVENDCFAFLDPSHHDIVNLQAVYCQDKTRQAFLDFPDHNIVPPLDNVDRQAVQCSFPDKILTISIQDIDIDIGLGLDIDIVDMQAVY